MSERDQLATFRVNPQQWDKFKEWCQSSNTSAALTLCRFIDKCLDGSIPDPFLGQDILIDSRLDSHIDSKIKELLASYLDSQSIKSTKKILLLGVATLPQKKNQHSSLVLLKN